MWRMFDSEGDIIDKCEKPATGIEAATAELRKSFAEVEGDFVQIVISPRKLGKGGDQTTGVYRFRVKCAKQVEATASQATVITKAAAGAVTATDGLTDTLIKLNVMIKEQEKNAEIRELQRQLEESKSSSKNGKHKLLERYLEKLFLQEEQKPIAAINGTQIKKQPVKEAAPAAAPTADEKKAAIQKISLQLQRLQKVSENLPGDLERLADFAEKNPALFQQYVKQL